MMADQEKASGGELGRAGSQVTGLRQELIGCDRFCCKLKILWQSDQAKGDNSEFREVVAVVRNPKMDVKGGGGGGGETEKEVKADELPEVSRPVSITVPETDSPVEETDPDLEKDVDDDGTPYEIPHLFIRVARARNLMGKDNNGLSNPYVRVGVGHVKRETKIIRSNLNPEWNQIFAIPMLEIQGHQCEFTIWDADELVTDDFLGGFMIEFREIPYRSASESPVPPLWYKLSGKGRVRGEVMYAIWWGTQTDEAYPSSCVDG